MVQIIADIPEGSSQGKGWIIKREGNTAWILTNRHVLTSKDILPVSPKAEVEVEFFSDPPPGEVRLQMSAQIVEFTDPQEPLDMALLREDMATLTQ